MHHVLANVNQSQVMTLQNVSFLVVQLYHGLPNMGSIYEPNITIRNSPALTGPSNSGRPVRMFSNQKLFYPTTAHTRRHMYIVDRSSSLQTFGVSLVGTCLQQDNNVCVLSITAFVHSQLACLSLTLNIKGGRTNARKRLGMLYIKAQVCLLNTHK